MFGKVIGGTLLIIGTSIGAGMLALPVATAGGGFFHSLWLFFAAWSITVLGAFYILEVNLWLPESTNLVSMAKKTLGPIGQLITWLVYLLLLYALLSAYTAGGADLVNSLLATIHINTPNVFDAILFVLILAAVIYQGVRAVDLTNRGLMSVKLIAYVLLVVLILPHIQLPLLKVGSMHMLGGAVMVVITSFGYATIVPSLRYYYQSNVKALRLTIALGSLISLVIYILWDLAVQGTVPSIGSNGLISMMAAHTVSQLSLALSHIAQSSVIGALAHVFTSICLTTSFLGVGLCLKDFLTDGFGVRKESLSGRWIVISVTFIPPLLVVLFYPQAFILALTYAGIFCVVLLMLLPAAMAFSGRYLKRISQGYQVWGGKTLVLITLVVSLLLTIYGYFEVR